MSPLVKQFGRCFIMALCAVVLIASLVLGCAIMVQFLQMYAAGILSWFMGAPLAILLLSLMVASLLFACGVGKTK